MNIQKLMKQAQQMQKQIADMQEQLSSKEYTGNSGGGAVTVTINGKAQMKSVKIDKSLIDPSDVEMLEDLIVAAFNNAKKECDNDSESSLSGLAGGMGLPSGFKFPF